MQVPCSDFLPVSVAAVFYSKQNDRIAQIMEADTIIACAETELRRFDILEAFNIAFACGQIAGKNMQDAQRFSLIYGTKLRFGLIGPDELLVHNYLSDSRGSSGVRPMRSKSSLLRPNSESTFSLGMG